MARTGFQAVASDSVKMMRHAVPWYTVISVGLALFAFLFVAQFFTFAFDSTLVAAIIVATIIAMAPVSIAWIGQIYLVQVVTDGEASLDFAVAGVKARIVPFAVIAFVVVLVNNIASAIILAADAENLAVVVPLVVVLVALGLFEWATLWSVGPALAIHEVPGSGIVSLMFRSIRRGGLEMVGANVLGLLLAVGYGLLLVYAGGALGVPWFLTGTLGVAGVLTVYVFLFVFSAELWKHRRFEILGLDASAVLDMQTADVTSPEAAAPTGEWIAKAATFEPCDHCGNVFNAAAVRCPQCTHDRPS